ncbi:hypothetical protein MMC17_006845 [Xylographa soralifera]|nr:hypothetical protein [Xylographa soralifera]
MPHQPQKSSPLATSGQVPSPPTSSSLARKSQGDNSTLRETIQVARRRSKEWPWEVRLLHLGSYLAAAKVVAPAIRQVRSHDAAGPRNASGETDSLAERGGLLNDTGSIAERGSVAGTSLAGTSVLN